MIMASELPDYKSPPVTEVVVGVQFDELTGFLSTHYGRFWDLVRSEYPQTEDRPPLAMVFEGGVKSESEIEVAEMPPLRRVFFIDESGQFLLQVQPSRFLHNWRRVRPDDPYPHFPVAWRKFHGAWERFIQFVSDNKVGSIRTNQYELTYINHIVGEQGSFPVEWGRHLPLFAWDRARSFGFLPDPKGALMNVRFALPDGRGSLQVSAKHASRISDKKGILALELTARGMAKPDWSDMSNWFELAHEWIVKGFTDLTSSHAHKVWGRFR